MAAQVRIMDILRSLWIYVFAIVSMPLCFVVSFFIWLVTFPFDRRLKVLHAFTCFWASLYTWVAPFWKVLIENRDRIDRKKVYVIVSNHQSMLDILVLYRLFAHFKWVSKIENFKIPVAGWNMSMNRYIRLRRGKKSSILHMMEDGRKMLISGSSLMIFPEGTRSVTGNIGRFHEGAFRLAKDTQKPILPVVLDGTGNALPKHGFFMKGKHCMIVRILDEIPPDFFADMTARELMDYTRDLMIKELRNMRNRMGQSGNMG